MGLSINKTISVTKIGKDGQAQKTDTVQFNGYAPTYIHGSFADPPHRVTIRGLSLRDFEISPRSQPAHAAVTPLGAIEIVFYTRSLEIVPRGFVQEDTQEDFENGKEFCFMDELEKL